MCHSHHASQGTELCSRGAGTRARFSGLAPPLPSLAARGEGVPGGSTCVLQERNRVSSGLLGLKSKQVGVPSSAAQAALPWSLCPVCSFPNAARPTSCARLARPSPTARSDRATGLNLWGQHKQVLEQQPGRQGQGPGLSGVQGCPGTAGLPSEATRGRLQIQQARASDSENMADASFSQLPASLSPPPGGLLALVSPPSQCW